MASQDRPDHRLTRDDARAAVPFTLAGTACTVAGGLVAAITATAPSEQGAWAAAYLVLVAGVAQVALGAGQAWLAPRPPSPRLLTAQFTGWNAGNAAVLAGTLLGVTSLVDAGGAVLAVALGMLVHGTRGARAGGAGALAARRRWSLHVFRLLVVVLLVSIPIGLVLARTT